MSKDVTMRDIARELGLSAVSVSKALSGQAGVSDTVRERIVKTANDMGYRYEQTARRQVSRDIGVLVPGRYGGIGLSFYANLCQKVIRCLTEMKCYGVMEVLEELDERRNLCPSMALNGRVEGLIILGQVSRDYIRMLESECPVPYLCLDFYDERSTADAVTSDSLYGVYRLTSHLIHMGHRDIAFLGSIKATSSILDRYLGYYRSMLQHDLPMRPEWLIEDRDERGQSISFRLPDIMPTAIVCNCDLMAQRAISQLAARGLRVPDDVSVVGFDDFIDNSGEKSRLTTYAVDVDNMARIAAERIVGRLNGALSPAGRVVVGGRIVYRDSVRRIGDAG